MLAAAILGLGATALTAHAPQRLQGFFYCNHKDYLDLPNGAVNIVVAGAGFVSHLEGPVVCFTDDEIVYLNPADPRPSSATYTLRDVTGDTIVLSLKALPTPPSSHAITFGGTFEIIGGTGRFAGATGTGGVWSGWADYDDVTMTIGQGYWKFEGPIVLPPKAHCPDKK